MRGTVPIEAIRAALRGEALCPVAQTFEITRSLAHGHVHAVHLAMQRLGVASLLASKPCRERDLVLAMVALAYAVPGHQAGHHAPVAHQHHGAGVWRR